MWQVGSPSWSLNSEDTDKDCPLGLQDLFSVREDVIAFLARAACTRVWGWVWLSRASVAKGGIGEHRMGQRTGFKEFLHPHWLCFFFPSVSVPPSSCLEGMRVLWHLLLRVSPPPVYNSRVYRWKIQARQVAIRMRPWGATCLRLGRIAVVALA